MVVLEFAYGSECEVWFLLFDEVPGCAFSEGFAAAIGGQATASAGLFASDGVPVLLGVRVGDGLVWVNDCCEGRGDDHPSDRRCFSFDCLEDTCGAIDCGCNKIVDLCFSLRIEMIGTCCVYDGFEGRRANNC